MGGFKFDDRAFRKLLQRMENDIAEADRQFRETHTGLPIHVVRADAAEALPDGLTLPGDMLDAYAEAVAFDEPFEFHLQG